MLSVLCMLCREGFVGLSVADTIRQCLKLGLKDQAAKIAKDFKVGCQLENLQNLWIPYKDLHLVSWGSITRQR